MPPFVKKTFPLGWIPSDDEYNGRDDGLLRMNNCTLNDIGIVRGIRGSKIISDRTFTDPINLYSKVVRQGQNNWIKLKYVHHKGEGIIRNYGAANSETVFDKTVISHTGEEYSAFLSTLGTTFITLADKTVKDLADGTITENLGIPKANPPLVSTNAPVIIRADRLISGTYSTWDTNPLVAAVPSNYLKTDVVGCTGGDPGPQLNFHFQGSFQAGRDVTFTEDLTAFGGATGTDSPDDIYNIKILCDDFSQLDTVDIIYYLETPPINIFDTNPPKNYYVKTFSYTEIAETNPANNNWNLLTCNRSQFIRNGSNATLSWKTVKGIRISFFFKSTTVVTCYFQDFFFSKATGTLNGTYVYRQVNAEDNGYYLEQGIMSDPTTEIKVVDQSINVDPSIVPTPGNVALIYRMNTEIGVWHLIKQINSATKGFDPAPFVDTLEDVDAELESANSLLPLEEFRTPIPGGVIDMIFFQDRVIYLTSIGIYPSFKLDPGSYDSRFKYEIADGINEICLFLVKIDESRFFVGTNQDIYGVVGTLSISTGPPLIQDLTISPLGIKFPPIARACFVESSTLFYCSRDGWRFITGSSNDTITNQLAMIYNEYLRYSTGPISIDASNVPRQYSAFARGMSYFTFENNLGVRSLLGLNKSLQYWTHIDKKPNETPHVIYAEEDNTLIYLPTTGNLYELDSDESIPVEIDILSKKYDFGYPGVRKDINAFKLVIDTNGQDMLLIVNGIGKTINSSLSTNFIFGFPGPATWVQFQIIGTVSGFKFYGFMADVEPRPIPSMSYTSNAKDFGDPRKKKFRNFPITIDTLGNDVIAQAVLDCRVVKETTINTTCPRVQYILPACEDFATTGEVRLSGGPFEFYHLHVPAIVEMLPLEKVCDQIGPLEGYKLGDVKSIRLRLLPYGNNLTWRAYNHDVIFEEGELAITPNQHEWYEIFLEQKTSAISVIRFEFDSELPFHRTAGVFKIRTVGKETEFQYVNWPS